MESLVLPLLDNLDRDLEKLSVKFFVYDDIVFHFLLATFGSMAIFLANSLSPRGKAVEREHGLVAT